MDNRTINKAARLAIGGAVPLEFKQIAVTAAINNDGSEMERLVGLTEDGQVWEYRSEYLRFAQEQERVNSQGIKYKCSGEMVYWWHPLRMSADKGPESEPPPAYVRP